MKKLVLILCSSLLVVSLSFSLPNISSSYYYLEESNIEAFQYDSEEPWGATCTMGCKNSATIECCVQCWDCHLYLMKESWGDRDTCDTD
ncbi:MAG: hypothetical protein R6V34_00710 [Bacteroidales bacterium]